MNKIAFIILLVTAIGCTNKAESQQKEPTKNQTPFQTNSLINSISNSSNQSPSKPTKTKKEEVRSTFWKFGVEIHSRKDPLCISKIIKQGIILGQRNNIVLMERPTN